MALGVAIGVAMGTTTTSSIEESLDNISSGVSWSFSGSISDPSARASVCDTLMTTFGAKLMPKGKSTAAFCLGALSL